MNATEYLIAIRRINAHKMHGRQAHARKDYAARHHHFNLHDKLVIAMNRQRAHKS